LGSSLSHLESSLAGLDRMVNSDQSRLNKMLSHASSIAGNIDAHREDISAILSNMNRLSDTLAAVSIKQTVEAAGQSIAQLNQVLERINRGEGTLGQLVANDTLYRRLETSALHLDSLLIDLKTHPKRYLHFSVFGRKDK
jgi:phospholipid/cholesterol/gamma-HCH transport system substrate-binding protein